MFTSPSEALALDFILPHARNKHQVPVWHLNSTGKTFKHSSITVPGFLHENRFKNLCTTPPGSPEENPPIIRDPTHTLPTPQPTACWKRAQTGLTSCQPRGGLQQGNETDTPQASTPKTRNSPHRSCHSSGALSRVTPRHRLRSGASELRWRWDGERFEN